MSQPGAPPRGSADGDARPASQPAADATAVQYYYRTPRESNAQHAGTAAATTAAAADLPSPPSPEDLCLGDPRRNSHTSTGNSSRLTTPTSANVPQFTTRVRRRHGSSSGLPSGSRTSPTATTGHDATNSNPTSSTGGDGVVGSSQGRRSEPRFAGRGTRAGSGDASQQYHRERVGGSRSRHGSQGAGPSPYSQSAASSGRGTPAPPSLYGSNGLFTSGGRHGALSYGNAAAAAAGHHGHFPPNTPVYVSAGGGVNTPTSAAELGSPTGSQPRANRRLRGNTLGIAASAQAWHWGPTTTTSSAQQQQPQQPGHQRSRHGHRRSSAGGGGSGESSSTEDRRSSRGAPESLFSAVQPSMISPTQSSISSPSTAVSSPATAGGGNGLPQPTPTSASSHGDAQHVFPRQHPPSQHGSGAPPGSGTSALTPVSDRTSGSGNATAAPGGGVGVVTRGTGGVGAGGGGSGIMTDAPLATFARRLSNNASTAMDQGSGSPTTTTTTVTTPQIVTPTTEFERSFAHGMSPGAGIGGVNDEGAMWARRATSIAAASGTYGESQHPNTTNNSVSDALFEKYPRVESQGREAADAPTVMPNPHTATPPLPLPSTSSSRSPSRQEQQQQRSYYELPPSHTQGAGHVLGAARSFATTAATTANSDVKPNPLLQPQQPPPPPSAGASAHFSAGSHAGAGAGGDFLRASGVFSGEESTLYSLNHSTSNSRSDSPHVWENPVGAMDRAYTSTEAQMTLHQQRLDDARMQDALHSLGVGTAAATAGETVATTGSMGGNAGVPTDNGSGGGTAAQPQEATASTQVLTSEHPPFSTHPGLIGAECASAADALIDWGRAYACGQLGSTSAATAAAQSRTPGAAAEVGRRRLTVHPSSPPAPGSNPGTAFSFPLAQRASISSSAAAAAAAAAATQPSLWYPNDLNASMSRRATGIGGWQGMNSSALFYLNSSMNASALLDPFAASVVMQQNRTALVAELKRRRQRLQKQLGQLQKEATARNIFALIRASNASQVQYLLQEGLCSVNDRDYNGCTPLHVAAGEGNQAIVRVLLSFGADVLAVDHNGRTPLDCAAANRHSGVGRYLLTVIRNQHLAQEANGGGGAADEDTAGGAGTRAGWTPDQGLPGVLPHTPTSSRASPRAGGGEASPTTTTTTTTANNNTTTTAGGLRHRGSGWYGTPKLMGGSFAAWPPTPPAPRRQHEQRQTTSTPSPPSLPLAPSPPDTATPPFPGTAAGASPLSAQQDHEADPHQRLQQQQQQQVSASYVADASANNNINASTSSLVFPSLPNAAAAAQTPTSTSLAPPPPQQQQQGTPSDAGIAASSAQWRRNSTPHGSSPMRPVVLSALHTSAAERSREILAAASSLSGATVSPSSVATSPHMTASSCSAYDDVSAGSPSMRPMLPPSAAAARATAAGAAVGGFTTATMSIGCSDGSGLTSPAVGSVQSNSQPTPQLGLKSGSSDGGGVGGGGAPPASSMMMAMMQPSSSAAAAGMRARSSDAPCSGSTPPTLHDRPIVSAPPYLAVGMDTSPSSEAAHDLSDGPPSASITSPHNHNHHQKVGGEQGGRAGPMRPPSSAPPGPFDGAGHATSPPTAPLPESSLEGEATGGSSAFGPTPSHAHFAEPLNEDELQHLLLGRGGVLARQKLAGAGGTDHRHPPRSETPSTETSEGSSMPAAYRTLTGTAGLPHNADDHFHYHDDGGDTRAVHLRRQQQQARAGLMYTTSAFTAASAGDGGGDATSGSAKDEAPLNFSPGTRMLRPFNTLPLDSQEELERADRDGARAATTATASTTATAASAPHLEFRCPDDDANTTPAQSTLTSDLGSLRGVAAYQPFKSSQRESLSACDVGQQSLEEHHQHFRLTATTGMKLLRSGGAVARPFAATTTTTAATTAAARGGCPITNTINDGGAGEGGGLAGAAEHAPDSAAFAAATQPAHAPAETLDNRMEETGKRAAGAPANEAAAAIAATAGHPTPKENVTVLPSSEGISAAAGPIAISDAMHVPPPLPQQQQQQHNEATSTLTANAPPAPQPQRSNRHAEEEQNFMEQLLQEPLDLATLHHSSYTTVCDTVSIIVCMVGLPGRGKSFIGKRLVRYMNWKGVPCRVFNAGDYRRQLLGVEGTANAAFFDPNNPIGAQLREKMAELACEALVGFISTHPLAVGILDATNTTRKRRAWLNEYFQQEAGKRGVPFRLLFIESVCTDDTIITENILRSKCDNDDFKNVKDVGAIIADFRNRILQYEKVYETCEPAERMSYIKIINVKHHVILHHVPNGLGSRIAFFLLNLHPVAFPIYIALPGETVGDKKHAYGGEERLTSRGEAYAVALKNFIQDRYVPHMVVLHATNYSVLSTLAPLMDGATEDDAALILQVAPGANNTTNIPITTTSNGAVPTNHNGSAACSAGAAAPYHPSKTGTPSPQQLQQTAVKRAPPPPSVFRPAAAQTQTQSSASASAVVVVTPTGAVAGGGDGVHRTSSAGAGTDPLSPALQDAPASLPVSTASSPHTSTATTTTTAASPTSNAVYTSNQSEGEVTASSGPNARADQQQLQQQQHRRRHNTVFPTKHHQHRRRHHHGHVDSCNESDFTLDSKGSEESSSGSSGNDGSRSNSSSSSSSNNGSRPPNHMRRRSSSSRSHRSRSRGSSYRATLPNTEVSVSKLHPYSPTTTVEELRAMAGGDLSAVPLPSHRSSSKGSSRKTPKSAAGSSTTSRTHRDDDELASAEDGGAAAAAAAAAAVRAEAHDEAEAGDENSSNGDGSESEEMCDEVLCPVPGLDNINYGRFSGHTASWIKEKYPRLSAMLYDIADDNDGDTNRRPPPPPLPAAGGAAGAAVPTHPVRETTKAEREAANPPQQQQQPSSGLRSGNGAYNNLNDWLSATLPPPVHYATHEEAIAHLQHAPTGADPRLSYCIQFPNGESCRQVNVRLEPALMAVMRTQSPVFVVAPAVPAQGVLAFFMDVIPELSPTLRIPGGCVVEIGVKNGITVHPLLPDALPDSMKGSPVTELPELPELPGEAAAPEGAGGKGGGASDVATTTPPPPPFAPSPPQGPEDQPQADETGARDAVGTAAKESKTGEEAVAATVASPAATPPTPAA